MDIFFKEIMSFVSGTVQRETCYVYPLEIWHIQKVWSGVKLSVLLS